MDFFVGIKGPDFVMVCSDTSAVHSIITIKQDEDKIVPIDSHKLFCLSGEAGDRVQFSEYVIANVKLYALRNATRLSTKSVAHYTRGELAVALRKVRACVCAVSVFARAARGARRRWPPPHPPAPL
jgi:20S proteasome subunit beta 4